MSETTRRDVLRTGAALAATAAASQFFPAHAAGTDTLKLGVIGCGGRGTGAVEDNFNAGPGTVLWAAGDVFENKAKGLVGHIGKNFKDRVDVGDRAFGGLEAAQKVIDSGVDLVILATSPGFRPFHLEAVVKAAAAKKKPIHIFCEKPVAVDGAGIQMVLKAAEEAKKLGISVVAGTQRRHQAGYIETVKQIHDGKLGDIVSARCSWNGSEPWFRARQKSMSDVEYQINNWYHFLWLCGDHIDEQHVHNLDVINWVMKGHPEKAVGQGGRIGRKEGEPSEVGNIYDLFAIEYEYAGGVPVYSYCSHVPGTTQDVSETVYGTKGVCRVNAYQIGKEKVFGKDPINPYVQEHKDLMASIRDGKPVDELTGVAESTLTAIMGRMAVYTGKVVTWKQALEGKSTMPANLKLDMKLEAAPVPRPFAYFGTHSQISPHASGCSTHTSNRRTNSSAAKNSPISRPRWCGGVNTSMNATRSSARMRPRRYSSYTLCGVSSATTVCGWLACVSRSRRAKALTKSHNSTARTAGSPRPGSSTGCRASFTECASASSSSPRAASLNLRYSSSCFTSSRRGSGSSSPSARSSAGTSERLLISMRVAAITRKSPAASTSSTAMARRYATNPSATFASGSSRTSTSSRFTR